MSKKRKKAETEQPTPAEVAQDAAVGETLAPTQPMDVDAGPLSEADRRLIASLESAYAEVGREAADLQRRLAVQDTPRAAPDADGADLLRAAGGVEIGGAHWLSCTTCGGLVLPGATCPTDGQVAPC